MSKCWRLTKRAERSLYKIAVWTSNTFGPRQAAAYENDLIACCDSIALGQARVYSFRKLFGEMLPEKLQATRIGGHFIIFVEADTGIVITDFLHAQRDVPDHLAVLHEAEPH